MSGLEVAGLILGAIPLIIEGFKRSQMAFAAFEIYRHYPKELMKLDAKIGAQKTVFRNNCINLLSTIVNDRPKINAMLTEASHDAWQDEGLHNTLATQIEALDESFTSSQRTMDQIYNSLQNICREMESFQTVLVVKTEGDQESISNREWCRRLGKRIKLSLNKPKIETHIEELRSFNADFNLISNQIISRLKDTAIQNPTSSTQITRALPSLIRYQRIRNASQWLYEALVNRWSCSLHSNHWANISLDSSLGEPLAPQGIQTEKTSTVRLEMAITYYTGAISDEVPIWLEIESCVDTGLTCRTLPNLQKLHDISTTLQAGTGAFTTEKRISESKKVKPRRTVHFDEDVSQELQTLSLNPPEPQKESAPTEPMIDLCLIQDVCEHFQKHQGHSHPQFCMGYLNDSCVQRFYQPPAKKCFSGKPKSLEEVIVWVSEDPIRVLPRSIMIQLGASLAAAVLRYHSTPWLSGLWKSKDIVFFGIGDFKQGAVSLRHPHLHADFARSKGKGKETIEGDVPRSSSFMDTSNTRIPRIQSARNEVLFGLGIVLLEVGFMTPWATLRANMTKAFPNDNLSEYMIADKLACLLVNSMGPKYSKIIRKCLGCDFGLGETDLVSEELQGKFLSDVVFALKELEERFPVY